VTVAAADGTAAALFASLSHTCVACGRLPGGDPCGDTVTVRDLLAPVEQVGIVGRQALVHSGPLSRAEPDGGLVLAFGPRKAEVLLPDGRVTTVPSKRVQVSGPQPGGGVASCAGGELLAASLDEYAEPTRRLLHDRALAFGAAGPEQKHRLARDAARLGALDRVQGLGFDAGELVWWRALADWAEGRTAQTLVTLLELPPGRYPMQLAVWWSAARADQVSEDLRQRAAPVLDQLSRVSPECAVAAFAVTRALVATGAHPERLGSLDRPLVGAVRQILARHGADRQGRAPERDAWHALSVRLGIALDGSPARRLREAWQALPGAAARQRLGDDPAVLDEMPAAVLDDFIDAGVLPPEWLARAGELGCGDHVLGRTGIAHLDDATLERLGAHEERARRIAAAGRPVPDAIPLAAVERRRLNLAAAAATGGDELVLQAIRDRAGENPALARALEEPSVVPDAAVLDDPIVATLLLRRSKFDGGAAGRLNADGLDERQRRYASLALLRAAKDALHQWDWTAAADLARNCLRLARVERQRDEALNLLAAAHWELGNDEEAIRALQVALEGDHTAALQANIAVVAAELEPRIAATHLARLVHEAPNLPLRVSAAKQVLLIWGHNLQVWQDTEQFPHEIAVALRSLVVQPIDEPDFREIVRLLAEHDGAWLAQAGALAGSPHARSPAARVWSARARAIDEFVRELASCLRAAPEPWMEGLRDELVRAALKALTSQADVAAAAFAMLLVDEGLPMEVAQAAILRGLTAMAAAAGIDPAEAEPTHKLLDWLDASQSEVDRLPAAERTGCDAALVIGYDALGTVYAQARRNQLDDVANVVVAIQDRLAGVPFYQVDVYAVRQITAPASKLCDDTISLMRRLRPRVSAMVVPMIDEVSVVADHYRDALERLGRVHG